MDSFKAALLKILNMSITAIYVLHFKKPKVWGIMAASILCLGVIAACAANPQTMESTPASTGLLQTNDISNILGYYGFDENVYTNPLSSFLPVKGYMPFYEITGKALRIQDKERGPIQEITAVFEKKPLKRKDFESWFEPDFHIPDISSYRECYQYAVFSAGGTPEYRLYAMDAEIWLAMFQEDRIWSIYQLVKIEEKSRAETGGSADTADAAGGQYDLTDLEQAVVYAILTENKSGYRDGEFEAEAHTTFKTVAGGNKVTVYAMVLYQEYVFDEKGIADTPSGSHMPVAMTFERSSDDVYHLREYWTPKDGSYYVPSIKEKFPDDIYRDAIDTQKYIKAHQKACDDKAMRSFASRVPMHPNAG